jgi:ABC-type cobalamin transport system ATPase subunit
MAETQALFSLDCSSPAGFALLQNLLFAQLHNLLLPQQAAMAPVITHPDISHTLQHAAQKWHRKSQIMREEGQRKLSPSHYRQMTRKLNQTNYVPPPDSDNTKANIYYIREKFKR